jgi:hypothetical protein
MRWDVFTAMDTDDHASVAVSWRLVSNFFVIARLKKGAAVGWLRKRTHGTGECVRLISMGNQHRGIDMRAPAGSIVGLCSASATMCAVGMAFLGYWGVHEPVPWRWTDRVVVCLAFASFAALGSVAWIVTTPVADESAEKIVAGRRAFALGVTSIWLAIVIAVIASA